MWWWPLWTQQGALSTLYMPQGKLIELCRWVGPLNISWCALTPEWCPSNWARNLQVISLHATWACRTDDAVPWPSNQSLIDLIFNSAGATWNSMWSMELCMELLNSVGGWWIQQMCALDLSVRCNLTLSSVPWALPVFTWSPVEFHVPLLCSWCPPTMFNMPPPTQVQLAPAEFNGPLWPSMCVQSEFNLS